MLTAVPAGLVKFTEQMKAATGLDLADILKKIDSMEDGTAGTAQIRFIRIMRRWDCI